MTFEEKAMGEIEMNEFFFFLKNESEGQSILEGNEEQQN